MGGAQRIPEGKFSLPEELKKRVPTAAEDRLWASLARVKSMNEETGVEFAD